MQTKDLSSRGKKALLSLLSAVAFVFNASAATAGGSGANIILYNHYLSEKGELELEVFSDFANPGRAGSDYTAQKFELEYGVTDRWTAAIWLEGVKSDGENYQFGGFHIESLFKLSQRPIFLNPVFYIEYEQVEPEHRFLHSVTGRTGEEEHEEDEDTEYELETKLILSQDVSSRLNVAFNWINEVNLKTGDWGFGYAAGLNYTLFETEGGHHDSGSRSWEVEEVVAGLELFGGLGDSVDGLTLDGGETAHYLGLNLKTEFENGIELGLGGAFGLTDDSEDALIRTMFAVKLN